MPAPNPFDLVVRPLWATPFFSRLWCDHPQVASDILQHLYSLRDRQTENIESRVASRAKSGRGLYESQFDLFTDPHLALQRLVGFIRTSLAEAVCLINGSELTPADVIVEFIDSWYHITNSGGFHDAHFHNGCSWCGVYYLRIGTSGVTQNGGAPNGGSRFYSPLATGGGYRDYGNKYLTAFVDPPIHDGLLILFPSYLLHSGLPYSGPEDRVVLAFNARVYVTDAAAGKIRMSVA